VTEALGEDPRFNQWRSRKLWGGGSATFGPGVFDDLLAGVDEFMASEPGPAAIGCVYCLTNRSLARRLAKLDAVCIVLDKGVSQEAAAEIEKSERNFPIEALPKLGGMVTSWGGNEVGPMRVAGVGGDAKYRPVLHAKMLVLGDLYEKHYEIDIGEWDQWRLSRSERGSAAPTGLTKREITLRSGYGLTTPCLSTKRPSSSPT
jgi:hypothetical protein